MLISHDTMGLSQKIGDREAIRLIAEAGFDCADYSCEGMTADNSPLNAPDYRDYALELRRYAESLGIFFNQAHAPFTFNWHDETATRKINIPRTIRSMEIASILGADTVIIHSIKHIPYFHNMEKLWDINMSFFRELLPYAEKYNIRICLENLINHDKRGILVASTCADPTRYVRALDALNSPHIVACVDTGHAVLLGDDPADLISALGHERLHALHLHDNDGCHDLHKFPGLGVTDWDVVLKALAEIDYDGIFTLETSPSYAQFKPDFLPVAVKWAYDSGKYLANKYESFKA